MNVEFGFFGFIAQGVTTTVYIITVPDSRVVIPHISDAMSRPES
jgi:hypothetical protein